MATYKVVTHHLQELTWEVEADSPEQAEEEFGSLGTLISDESNESETVEVILICPQCQKSNLNEGKTLCWDCEGQP
tara:strand:- start:693 stop:920 length:228 start_codon:yes stop_codon:yes gene_type:complete